jgi:hypothetical protein
MTSIGVVIFNEATRTFTPTFVAEHAYVFIATLLIWIVHMYLGARVSGARKAYKVSLPFPYEQPNEKGEAKSDFNKYQRGHMVIILKLTQTEHG